MIENPCEPMKNCHSGVGIPPFLDKARMATNDRNSEKKESQEEELGNGNHSRKPPRSRDSAVLSERLAHCCRSWCSTAPATPNRWDVKGWVKCSHYVIMSSVRPWQCDINVLGTQKKHRRFAYRDAFWCLLDRNSHTDHHPQPDHPSDHAKKAPAAAPERPSGKQT